MITRELLKSEIDKVQDDYLEVLYRIIQALSSPDAVAIAPQEAVETLDWQKFIEDTYGCLADDPIERHVPETALLSETALAEDWNRKSTTLKRGTAKR